MVFSSLSFLILFLPLVVAMYYVNSNMAWRNGLLLLASLLFYAMGEPVYIFLLIGSAAVNYILSTWMLRSEKKSAWLATIVVIDIGVLSAFKILPGLGASLGLTIPVFGSFPIGISFYTFQMLSYCIDVYRRPEMAQKSYLKFLLYVSFFPQLIAGPIVRYHDIEEQLVTRQVNITQFAQGLRRFCFGLGKKVLIANTLGAVVDLVYDKYVLVESGIMVLSAAFLYCLQIYYDFSGYSDMAIGLGKMFGFTFLENFDYPYGSTSMKEFWRKWHISLSSWFKEYLYIPLGGNRKGKLRTYLNKYIVFLCTGFWHGASLNFIIWGLIHGTFTVLEEQGSWAKKLSDRRVLGWFYQCIVVTVAFVFFRAESLKQALTVLKTCVTGWGSGCVLPVEFTAMFSPWLFTILIIAVLVMFDWKKLLGNTNMFITKKTAKNLGESGSEREDRSKEGLLNSLAYLASAVVLLLCVMSLIGNSYNPFIYFRF